jgi:hypothetical protein
MASSLKKSSMESVGGDGLGEKKDRYVMHQFFFDLI